MAKKELKTNAMRFLDQQKIPYQMTHYQCDTFIDGVSVAAKLGQAAEQTFKTLVTKGKTGCYYVFVIPVHAELDLKKAAKAVGEKSIEMLPVKDIQAVTGYIRGGCTPISMRKQYPTVIDKQATAFDQIHISGGRIGTQITLSPHGLIRVLGASVEEITL